MSKKDEIIVRFLNGAERQIQDVIIEETPLTIFLNGEQFLTLLSTPFNQKELAIGFLLSEGIIKEKDDIKALEINSIQNHVFVELKGKNILTQKLHGKRTITTGCGKGTIFYNVLDSIKYQELSSNFTVDVNIITNLMAEMQENSLLYKETGGVHSASLADHTQILYTREDIGRHNAVDKVLGRSFEDQIDLTNKILLTSGRLSSEIVLKVLKARIPILVSRSAPSSLAVQIARESGLTLCGFVRGRKLNCYSHSHRLKGGMNNA